VVETVVDVDVTEEELVTDDVTKGLQDVEDMVVLDWQEESTVDEPEGKLR
jgi:hypothetical protein